MKVTLYCPSDSELQLNEIKFHDRFAVIETDDFPLWKEWVDYPRTPHIEVIPEDEIAASDPDALICPECALAGETRAFKNALGYRSHLAAHARKQG